MRDALQQRQLLRILRRLLRNGDADERRNNHHSKAERFHGVTSSSG
jgi:hypothetical protein